MTDVAAVEPAFPQPIQVVTTADSAFWRPLSALLASVSESTADSEVEMTVISPDGRLPAGIDDLPNLRVRAFDLRRSALDITDSTFTLPAYLPPMTLGRLAIEEVLPTAQRAIYLDADTLVRSSLADLWSTDLEGHPVGAVQDAVVPLVSSPEGLNWRDLRIEPEREYFNSGVLLIDIGQWRHLGIRDKALAAMTRSDIRWGDQCALNIALEGNWKPLDSVWNTQAGHLFAPAQDAFTTATPIGGTGAPKIVHFNSSRLGRPWQHGCAHPFANEWLVALDRTTFAGWRPPRPPVLQQLAQSIRRRGGSARRRLAARLGTERRAP